MNETKSKDEFGACGVRSDFSDHNGSKYELKPKKKDICIHKKTSSTLSCGETLNAIKEEEV